jgi:hypothetical protein
LVEDLDSPVRFGSSGRISLIDLSQPAPTRLDLGAAADVVRLSPDHRRVLVLHSTPEWDLSPADGGVAMLWDVDQRAALSLPDEAINDPRTWACARIGGSISRAEWQRIAPGVDYHPICRTSPDAARR